MNAKNNKSGRPLDWSEIYHKVATTFHIVGREAETKQLCLALLADRNVLIEGPVGVGKTALAQAVAHCLGRDVVRVDGDSRFTEQKLTGWFDPSLVLKLGYSKKAFISGPLVNAMTQGSILFVNELNRMPEAVQNVLLPALDERIVQVPQLGSIKAAPGFLLIATQNPREFVATSHLSEALLDRMEWIALPYQSLDEEREIVVRASGFNHEPYLTYSVELVRLTRHHPKIKRGASVRAAIAIAQILKAKVQSNVNEQDFIEAAKLALPTRIELFTADAEGGLQQQIGTLVQELWNEVKKKHS